MTVKIHFRKILSFTKPASQKSIHTSFILLHNLQKFTPEIISLHNQSPSLPAIYSHFIQMMVDPFTFIDELFTPISNNQTFLACTTTYMKMNCHHFETIPQHNVFFWCFLNRKKIVWKANGEKVLFISAGWVYYDKKFNECQWVNWPHFLVIVERWMDGFALRRSYVEVTYRDFLDFTWCFWGYELKNIINSNA